LNCEKNLVFYCGTGLFSSSRAQENRVTVSGGYVFCNIEEVGTKATGWMINALFLWCTAGDDA